MNVLLVDDHGLFRAGIRLLLTALDPRLTFLEAASAAEAVALARAHADLRLCLLDLHLKNDAGLDALASIKEAAPEVAVVVVSGEDDRVTVQACIQAGAMSFVPKSATPEVLTQALRRVLAGDVFLPRGIGDDIPAAPVALTQRQRDVLLRLSRGLPNKLIARELGLSEHTVKEYIADLFRVLDVHNRTEAVIKASRLSLQRADA